MVRKIRETEDSSDDHMENDRDLDDGPPSINPYAVLAIEKDASEDEVKKAYRKQALMHHPDKALETDKTAANKKFQEIAFAYAVLSDSTRRARFDRTGSTEETMADDEDFNWHDFYRQQFEDLVTEENIKRISNSYKNSAEERRDLVDAYTKCKGSLDKIYSLVMLSDILEDDDRFRQILDEEIAKGTIESRPMYEKQNTDAARQKAKDAEVKRRQQFDEQHGEEAEATKAKSKSKSKARSKKDDVSDLGSLAALIQRKQVARGNFFDHLEDKYAPKAGKGKKRVAPEEPPEEMFEATAKRQRERATRKAKQAKVVEDVDTDDEDIVESEDEDSEEEVKKPKRKPRKGMGRKKATRAG
ncbi:DnaJ-domain-containing protein [Polyplosphaeria fusca]|uniref:DnaJ-domain-containing protein n=1 Tax=Polyplosphaeria fusca TaxID=682080 RepID=A0A9P4R2V1_9PLEO|nr:DnaJ-domain-containing protein [Polyplosphaeria fusca]